LLVASTSSSASHEAKKHNTSISLAPTLVRIPKKTIGPLVKGSFGVTAFDISPDQIGRYVVGGADGQLLVGSLGIGGDNTDEQYDEQEPDLSDIDRLAQRRMREKQREVDRQKRTPLQGHVGDIRSARFFSSGEVILSTSSDCTARIFGLDGSNPRTLKGHRRGITSSYLIGRGKEVLTSSSDGTTRLWDVGQGVQKQVFPSHGYSSVNVVSMGRSSHIQGQDDMQVDGESKLIITGLSSGHIECHDMASGSTAFQLPSVLFPSGEGPKVTDRWEQVTSSSVFALDWSQQSNLLVAGCSNGVTLMHDVRMLSSNLGSQGGITDNRSLLATWRRNGAAINEVRLMDNAKEAIVCTADGMPYRVDLQQSPRVVEEYNGWDLDNVQCSAIDARRRVWLAGAGGVIRMH
jgi:proteasomal ATPase-associated factor 1